MIKCSLCGARFVRGEVFWRRGEDAVCAECAEGLCVQDILFLLNAKGTREILAALAYEKDFI